MQVAYKGSQRKCTQKWSIKLERVSPSAHPEGEEVGADVADPHGLAQVVLHDRHLLGRALGAEQTTTVPAVVLAGGETELVLEDCGEYEVIM